MDGRLHHCPAPGFRVPDAPIGTKKGTGVVARALLFVPFAALWFSYLRETRVSSTIVFMGIAWPWTEIVMSIADFWDRKQPFSVE